MEDQTRKGYSRQFLILSVLLNLLLVGSMGIVLRERSSLQAQISSLTDSYQSLSQQLNITNTQLNYYKEQAEYYSGIVERENATAGFVGRSSVNVVAVQARREGFRIVYEGVTMKANIEAKAGEGRILVDTEPRIGIDIQTSARTAIHVAEDLTSISLSKTDIILTIKAEEEVDVVDGPSAGGCISVALLAALRGDSLDDSVYMTGTIGSDGSIGPVGGVAEKAVVAAEQGASIFIVPKDQGTIIVQEKKERHPFPGWTIITYEPKQVKLQEFLNQEGYTITVVEVDGVEEAYSYFIS